MADATVDFVLEKIMQLLSVESKLMHFDKDQIESIYDGLQFLRMFLTDSETKRNGGYEELKDVVERIRDLSWEVDETIDLLLMKKDGSLANKSDLQCSSLIMIEANRICGRFSEDIESLKTQMITVFAIFTVRLRLTIERSLHALDRFVEEIVSAKTGMQMHRKELEVASLDADDCLLSLSETMLDAAEKVNRALNCFAKDLLDSVEREKEMEGTVEKEVWMSPSSLISLYSFMVKQFYRLSVKIPHRFDRSWLEGISFSMTKRQKVGVAFGRVIREIESMETKMLSHEKLICETYEKEIDDEGLDFSLRNDQFDEQICGELAEMVSILREIKSCESPMADERLLSLSTKMICLGQDILTHIGDGYKEKTDDMLWKVMITQENGKGLPFTFVRFLITRQFGLLSNLSQSIESIGCGLASINYYIPRLLPDEEGSSMAWLESVSTDHDSRLSRHGIDHNLRAMVHLASELGSCLGRRIEEIRRVANSEFTRFTTSWITDEHLSCFKLGEISHICGSFTKEANSIMMELVLYKKRYSSLCHMAEKTCGGIERVAEEIKSLRIEVKEAYKKMKTHDISVQQAATSSGKDLSVVTPPIAEEEDVVGFGDETLTLKDLLTGEHGEQLKLIQILGMPGIGKTTLAKKIYNDPLIMYWFFVRAWTHVSQAYQKRDLLLGILCSAFQLQDEICRMTVERLGEELYKRLKGKRYLIVMDDIWDINAWDELKRYFPDDNNGSRIMFTGRLMVVDMAIPHYLRFLNEDESWLLLQQNVFGKESCPLELMEIGKQIAIKCGGLPLAIVVISGLLAKNDKTQHWWRHVAESVSSYTNGDQEKYMETLALSYNHLPCHLKPCFLYFGAFPEDYNIPVWKLISLWVSEGFICRNQQKRLEEVAEVYLMDLIDRNLVLVSKKKSNGGIRSCHVHDLLRDLCLKKAREEKFLDQVCLYKQTPSSMVDKQYRVCIYSKLSDKLTPLPLLPYEPCIRSILSFGLPSGNLSGRSFIFQDFQLLRVLDLSSFKILPFQIKNVHLLHLMYLAVYFKPYSFAQSISERALTKLSLSNFLNLETLIVDGERISFVLDGFWKMANLRHLYAKQSVEIPRVPNDHGCFELKNLQTVGKLDLCGLNSQILQHIPHLRKLKCSFMKLWGKSHIFPKLNFLLHLESLNVSYEGPRSFLQPALVDQFPPNLRSLTLSNFCLPWEEISTLGMLPNLEILKLLYKSFVGPRWDANDGAFAKLKFLKFRGLDIKQWNASGSHFPNLRTLVLDDCRQLEEIPSGLGDIFVLETIQLLYCSASAVNSAKQIEEQQLSMGNGGLKIFIHPYHNEYEDGDEDENEDEEHWNSLD